MLNNDAILIRGLFPGLLHNKPDLGGQNKAAVTAGGIPSASEVRCFAAWPGYWGSSHTVQGPPRCPDQDTQRGGHSRALQRSWAVTHHGQPACQIAQLLSNLPFLPMNNLTLANQSCIVVYHAVPMLPENNTLM